MKKAFDKLGVMLDCSRNAVMTVDAVKKMIDVLSKAGYNLIELYTEDTYTVDGEPYFGYMRGKYSKEDLRALDKYAQSKGMELRPCIQTLAHLNQIFRWKDYGPLNDINDILMVGDEKVYALIDNMFSTLADAISTRKVHIGMDEAWNLGRGQYLDKNGLHTRSELMGAHLKRVAEIAAKYGFTCQMWGDMFHRAAYELFGEEDKSGWGAIAKQIPSNVELIYWDYYSLEADHYRGKIDDYKRFTDNLSFAGGAWDWVGFTPHNAWSREANRQAIAVCREKGIKEYLVTVWGDNGGECSPFAVLPALVEAAALSRGLTDEDEIKKLFKRAVGADFDTFMLLDLPDRIDTKENPDINNPSKYMLYNDVFMGLFDSTARIGGGKYYAETAEKLEAVRDKKWGYLFKSAAALCRVLEIKYDLGLKTHAAYKSGDKAAIKALADGEYTELSKRLKAFYNAYEAFWMTEKRPQGFDVQDVRLGGLMQRVAHCKARLLAYAAGKLDVLPELEEVRLDCCGDGRDFGGKAICHNQYTAIVTANVM